MLLEAYTWLTTPCAALPRRLGYLRESIATAARARRCTAAWAEHLARTRAVILDTATGGERVRILGAGLLHDVPLAELAARYGRVELVDWVFLRASRRAAGRHSNVYCVEGEVSGIVAALVQARTPEEVDALLALPEPDPEPGGLTISLNLLSQLPLLPLACLARRFPALDEVRLNAWGLALMHRHLERLRAVPEALLIADAQQTYVDRHGAVRVQTDYGQHFGYAAEAQAEWDWPLAPSGELPDGGRAQHRVVACRWRRTAPTPAQPSKNTHAQ